MYPRAVQLPRKQQLGSYFNKHSSSWRVAREAGEKGGQQTDGRTRGHGWIVRHVIRITPGIHPIPSARPRRPNRKGLSPMPERGGQSRAEQRWAWHKRKKVEGGKDPDIQRDRRVGLAAWRASTPSFPRKWRNSVSERASVKCSSRLRGRSGANRHCRFACSADAGGRTTDRSLSSAVRAGKGVRAGGRAGVQAGEICERLVQNQ